jgi:hypothetical protein
MMSACYLVPMVHLAAPCVFSIALAHKLQNLEPEEKGTPPVRVGRKASGPG